MNQETTTNITNDNQVNQIPAEKAEVNLLQNDAPDKLLPTNENKLVDNSEVKPTNLEDKLADLEAALQAFTPLDDALAAFGITNEEFNCYLDTLGMDAESYLKQQYGLGLVSFRSNLAILAATKPTAAKLLYDDLVNRGLVGNRDASNNNIVIKFEGDD